MGKFPIYTVADKLGIKTNSEKRITSWNENLTKALSNITDAEIHFITSTKLISKTTTINRIILELHLSLLHQKLIF